MLAGVSMTAPVSAEYKGVLNATIVALYAAIAGTSLFGATTGDWEYFAIAAPFGLLVWPGYLELLPIGGLKHPAGCACQQADLECELGFWSERGQRALLFLPSVLSAIFLTSFLYKDLPRALSDLFQATLLALAYVLAIAAALFVLAKTR